MPQMDLMKSGIKDFDVKKLNSYNHRTVKYLRTTTSFTYLTDVDAFMQVMPPPPLPDEVPEIYETINYQSKHSQYYM